MRIWVKVYDEARLVKSETIDNFEEDTRTHKILDALERACKMFDLANPLWLDSNINEFKKNSKTRFYQDNFVEEIDFDYLELHVIEED